MASLDVTEGRGPPVKDVVRKAEGLAVGDTATVELTIRS